MNRQQQEAALAAITEPADKERFVRLLEEARQHHARAVFAASLARALAEKYRKAAPDA